MFSQRHKIDLTQHELDLIEAALHTQEKILSLQNTAETGCPTQTRLRDIKSVLKTLNRQRHHSRKTHAPAAPAFWPDQALSLFI